MQKPFHIVVTTINSLNFLKCYQSNIEKFGHLNNVIIWVIGDNKTPKDSFQISKELNNQGLEVHYWDIEMQDAWGKKFKEIYKKIPYDNEARRNIGYLLAYENNCEILISIDDDNFPIDQDFIYWHSMTGKNCSEDLLHDPSGFINICEFLELDKKKHFYPRGFPFNLRNHKNQIETLKPTEPYKIGLTEGLWINEPDIDAITWLNGTIKSKRYIGPERFIVDNDTWSPINTQNTSVTRELIPAFLCIPMGNSMPWGKIERYGDILGGYFFQSIIKNTQFKKSFGFPIVDHRRNPHNYINDLKHEYWGMLINDWILNHIKDFNCTSENIPDRIFEFSDYLLKLSETMNKEDFPDEAKIFIKQTGKTIQSWEKCIMQINGK